MASQNTRRLGTACRIYKNALDKVIAIDKLEVVVCELRLSKDIFRLSVDKINSCRTLLHLDVGASRVVSKIQMIGSYTSIEENGGDFLIATWAKGAGGPEDVVLSFEPKVAKLGDTV